MTMSMSIIEKIQEQPIFHEMLEPSDCLDDQIAVIIETLEQDDDITQVTELPSFVYGDKLADALAEDPVWEHYFTLVVNTLSKGQLYLFLNLKNMIDHQRCEVVTIKTAGEMALLKNRYINTLKTNNDFLANLVLFDEAQITDLNSGVFGKAHW